MKKIIILIVIILIIGFFWFKKGAAPAPASTPTPNTATEGTLTTPPAPVTEIPAANTKEFTIIGSNFSFTRNKLEVKVGDTVRITFKNADGLHNLKLDDFQVATKQIKAGESETVEFVADKAGAFEYYCSIGNHRAMGMKGTLNVTQLVDDLK